MKTGRSTAKGEITGKDVSRGLLQVVGIGLLSGIALVAGTNKVMNKFFPQKNEGETKEAK